MVKTGIQDDSNIEIVTGLSEEDEVITGPYTTVTKTLKTGDKVEVKSARSEAEGTEDES